MSDGGLLQRTPQEPTPTRPPKYLSTFLREFSVIFLKPLEFYIPGTGRTSIIESLSEVYVSMSPDLRGTTNSPTWSPIRLYGKVPQVERTMEILWVSWVTPNLGTWNTTCRNRVPDTPWYQSKSHRKCCGPVFVEVEGGRFAEPGHKKSWDCPSLVEGLRGY